MTNKAAFDTLVHYCAMGSYALILIGAAIAIFAKPEARVVLGVALCIGVITGLTLFEYLFFKGAVL
jgi:hypothetical protein